MIRKWRTGCAAAACWIAAACAAAGAFDSRTGVGVWIWDHRTEDRQECRFVRGVTIPEGATVTSARLRMTADNSYQLWIDGQPVGRGGDWRVLIEYDVRALLGPGGHGIAVSAQNDFDVAGMLFGLEVVLGDGRKIEIGSDQGWRIAPDGAGDWFRRSAAWDGWRPAKELHPPGPDFHPQIYRAPASELLRIGLWQRPWFRLALSVLAFGGIASGLLFGTKLFLKSRMERVVRRERARIAVDLHDDLGGGLTQLVLLGETSRREVPPDSPLAEVLDRLCVQSRGLMRGMNENVWLINSQRDTLGDFASYVVNYAESFFQKSPVRCRFDLEEDLPQLPCDLGVRRNFFLAVKEALNNVLRHSQATSVEISIHRERNELRVVIRDDGRGFETVAEGEGNGLHSMRRRAAEAGGGFRIESAPGAGCTVEFRLPVRGGARFGSAGIFPWTQGRRPAE